jgi:hypothetical protein
MRPNHTYPVIIVTYTLEPPFRGPGFDSEDVTTDGSGRGVTKQFSPRYGGALQGIDFLVDGVRRHGIGFQSRRFGTQCEIVWENDYPSR